MNLNISPARRRRDQPAARSRRSTPREPSPADPRRAAEFLQRSAGNRAVSSLLAGHGPEHVLLVQRAPEKQVKLTGQVLGTTKAGTQVQVRRELGGTEGYADRWQATAIARLAGAEPAAVVERADTKRWYAVEITAPFSSGRVGGDAKAGDSTAGGSADLSAVYGIPSLTGLPKAIENVARLKKRTAELAATQPADRAQRKALDEEKEQVRIALSKANLTRMALILGVPEGEIQWNRSSIGRSSGMINVTGMPDPKSPGGTHGPVVGQGQVTFTPTLKTAIEIDEDQFDVPARAQKVLFHETHHLKDYQFTQHWIGLYQTETGAIYVGGAPGLKPFQNWLTAQAKKKRLTPGDVQMIVDETFDVTATTEARANIHTFLALFQTGDTTGAALELKAYARALKPGGQYGSPPDNTPVLTELVAELKAAYATMARPLKAQYESAVKAAIAENPSAWITALKFFR